VRYEEAAKDLRQHYTTTGCRDLDEAEGRLAHLDRVFAGRRIATLGQADAMDYAARRQAEGAANGTINRELAVLGRMLRLAYEHGKLLRLPVLRKLKEAPPRAGFFERERYEAVRQHLRPDLQVAVAIAYAFGWRMQSEVLTLERRQVDLEAGTIRLDAGMTKNDEARVVYLTPELTTALAGQLARVRALERKAGRVIPWLFPHPTNGRRHHRGDRIRNFRKAWASACIAAGCYRVVGEDAEGEPIKVPTMLRHDFRRTAVRNLVNDGTPERVAMTITGHKTRAVFDRYHIVAPADLRAAAERMARREATRPTERGQPTAARQAVTSSSLRPGAAGQR
jgi:site-specific recombinase XerD